MTEQNSAQADNLNFDIEVFDKLLDTYTRTAYWGGPSGHVMEKFALIKYIYSLLAAKDAEIKRLEARQITPEMMQMYALYQRDEERGDPELRDQRLIGYAIPFFTRFLRTINPDWK